MSNRDERYRYDGYEDFNFSHGIRYEHLRATKHGRTLKAYCNIKKDHNYDRLYNCVDEDIEDEQTDYDTAYLEYEHEDSEWEETDDEGSYWEYPESESSASYSKDWPF